MLIDVFPFLDEVDLAELRIKYLSNTVDAFVVSEFDHGFSGQKKVFEFSKVLERLPHNLRKKVHYFPQEQKVFFTSPFANDWHQKDSISKIVNSLFSPNDLMVFGDLDEIPNRDEIRKITDASSPRDFYHFAQDNFLGFFNVIEVSQLVLSYAGEFSHAREKKWLGSICTRVQTLRNFSMTQLRDPEQKRNSWRIDKGGWHFSYCGGADTSFEERFARKMKYTAHQEFNKENLILDSLKTLKDGKDPFHRKFKKRLGPLELTRYPKFTVLKGLQHLPHDLSELCIYPKLILQS